jgi:hypothetical protein
MRISQIRLAAVALTSALVLAGCAYDDYGYGYGPYGYGYPHSSVSIGVGYGGGYGSYDPFGWYGNYYYPGTGIYVYDRSRTRHVWSGDQQRYWAQRRQNSGTSSTSENWSGWDRHRHDRDGTTTSTSTSSTSGTTTRWRHRHD